MGASHQIQIRHILVEKKAVADLLKETIDDVKSETGRVKMLMNLAGKYSACSSKEDGGNLGWLELGWENLSPGSTSTPATDYQVLKNAELETIIREGIQKMTLEKGKLFGPVKTREGYHLILISNEILSNRIRP